MHLPTLTDDLAWRLFRDGYEGIEHDRARHGGSDAYVTRLLGHRTVVVRGPEGVRLFYDESVVARNRAIPPPLAGLLFGRGAVHGLDGAEHRARKTMFLDVLSHDRTHELVTDAAARLDDGLRAWPDGAAVFDQLVEVYGAAVLAWAGMDVEPDASARLSHRLADVVGGFGFGGTAYLRAWRARVWLDRWAAGEVRETRDGVRRPPAGTALATIAAHEELEPRTAGVELLNVLRPTVAVAWPATMAVQRLLVHDDGRVPIDDLRAYVNECRRVQPFTPALAGRVRRAVVHGGIALRPGDRIVLDVVGTDTDPADWGQGGFDPERFHERFHDSDPDPYAFVPQGGGSPEDGHRCPGEPLAVGLIEATIRSFERHPVRVVEGGEPDPHRIPTLPDPPLRIAHPR